MEASLIGDRSMLGCKAQTRIGVTSAVDEHGKEISKFFAHDSRHADCILKGMFHSSGDFETAVIYSHLNSKNVSIVWGGIVLLFYLSPRPESTSAEQIKNKPLP